MTYHSKVIYLCSYTSTIQQEELFCCFVVSRPASAVLWCVEILISDMLLFSPCPALVPGWILRLLHIGRL